MWRKRNFCKAVGSMVAAVLLVGGAYSQAEEGSGTLPELTLDKSFYYVRSTEQDKSDWLKSSDVSLWFTQDGKPIYSFETIQPFGKVDSKGQLRFWQGRYAYNSESKGTANLGLGWRKLSADKSSIVGINTFYDYAFENNLSRIGLGSEYFHGLGEYR
ncbi:inverse autotransporter beta domain-containing protein, partial [Propionispora hippei]